MWRSAHHPLASIVVVCGVTNSCVLQVKTVVQVLRQRASECSSGWVLKETITMAGKRPASDTPPEEWSVAETVDFISGVSGERTNPIRPLREIIHFNLITIYQVKYSSESENVLF